MCKGDVPVRKRRIVAKRSLKGNKVRRSQPVLCPMNTKYLKMSIYLRNSR